MIFLQPHTGILLGIVTDPTKSNLFRIELAAVVDGGECLVKATYKLEGDGRRRMRSYKTFYSLFQLRRPRTVSRRNGMRID